MLTGGNLRNWLSGSARARELRETHAAWDATQARWQASPLARHDASDLALEIVQNVLMAMDRRPCLAILVAACEAVEALYRAEDIGDLEARWPVLETSVEAAVEFRQMLARRGRWAADFAAMNWAFARIVGEGLHKFFNALPECCFETADPERSEAFEVPLIDLLDDPAQSVEDLFKLPYDDETFRLDLFLRLREVSVHNYLLASGLPPTAHPKEHEHRLVMPTAQKRKTGSELSEMYLAGSPLRALVELPVPFQIPDERRFEHCHIVGGTGHGKTQLMQRLIYSDLLAAAEDGRSVVVIDSQGDLIDKLLRLELFAPGHAAGLCERLILVDPADVAFPAALNLFDPHLDRAGSYGAADRERVLNGVIELYELFFGAFLGAELTQKQGVVFKYLARLMLAVPGATIHTLMQIMEDGRPFKPHMDGLDGSARHFFETEFFHPAFAATKKQILRRLWGVLSTPAFERLFTQRQNKLDLFAAMNEGKIVLLSTAKDLLKREGSQLLGRFFIAMIAQAALERSTLPERLRNPAFVYVDEAQEYFDDSIDAILTQARKYRVGLTLAHQTLDQLSPQLRSSILANTSMKCAGGVSMKDARVLADELRTTPEFITGMRRRGERTEFALWVKQLTGQAIRLSVPLGFLERQPTLEVEDFNALIAANRTRYCGTLADVPRFEAPAKPLPEPEQRVEAPAPAMPQPRPQEPRAQAAPPEVPQSVQRPATLPPEREPSVEREPGKGGQQHRYLQSLVKQLAEQAGFKATVEAPLEGGGQVDVLLEREGAVSAIEISVTTPSAHERNKLHRCLAAGIPHIALVLAKSRVTRQRTNILRDFEESERARIVVLAPEDIPDYVACLPPPPEPAETVVKGYRVRVSQAHSTPADAKARRQALARIVARSLGRTPDA